ncbi:nitroreductase family protein [Lachnospiraceae bacterium 54-53]
MKLDFPVEQTVKKRHSVRTYENRGLSAGEKDNLNAYMAKLTNPFSIDVAFRLLESAAAPEGVKLGTYGVIKGAGDFIGASVKNGELGLEALGYSLEKLVLYATSLGLGTCWLGGTFNRSGFASAMNLKPGDLFPVITPVGRPLEKRRAMDSLMRWAAKSDQRKEWDQLFFHQDFSHPLTRQEADGFAFPLEMLRLAPSAVNKQPWRIVKHQNAFHFFEAKMLKEGKLGIDIQRVDMGIGACHFHLAAMEKDLPGRFEKLPAPGITVPDQTDYLFSWVIN